MSKKIDLSNSGPALAGWKTKFAAPKKIRLTDITADPALQHRVQVNPKTVEEYAEAMQEGAQFPAMRAVRDPEGNIWLYRGFTRLEAAKKVGLDTFPIELERGTRRDAWEKSLGENHDHGMRRTYEDLRKAIQDTFWDQDYGTEIRFAILDEDKRSWSFRKIAKLCKTNHHTVKKYWQEFHLPKITSRILDALQAHELDLASNEAHWLEKIAQEQNVPHHTVAKEWEAIKAERAAAEEARNIPQDEPEEAISGNIPTHQTTTVVSEDEPEEAIGGNIPTHQTTPVASEGVRDTTQKKEIALSPLADSSISSWPTEQMEPVSKDELYELLTNKASGLTPYRLIRPVSIQLVFAWPVEPFIINPDESVFLLL